MKVNSNYELQVTREQLPVGQGNFSVGEIRSRDIEERFNYIYDCGSTKRAPLRHAIDIYKSNVQHVNALFISHLDDDHVSGLDQLLSGVTVDTVFIPYVNEARLISDLLDAEFDGELSGALIEASLEPETWFGKRGVRKIVRVLPGPPPDELRDLELPEKSKDKYVLVSPEQKSHSGAAQTCEQSQMYGEAVRIMLNGVYIDWILVPYVHPVSLRNCSAFIKQLKATLDVPPRQKITSAQLADGLRHQDMRDRIRECYDEVIYNGYQKQNRLSMSLYSGPQSSIGPDWWILTRAGSEFRWARRMTNGSVGWMGTGDAELKVNKIRKAWRAFYAFYEESISTMVLPHHGSIRNFHPDLLRAANLDFCVASSGHGLEHHPDPAVVAAVQMYSKHFWQVSEKAGTSFFEVVTKYNPRDVGK